MLIKKVKPKIIRDSRKEKTIQIEISTKKGKFKASAPSGKSKGKYETPAYIKDISEDLKNLKILSKKLEKKEFKTKEFSDLKELDNFVKKSALKIGANSSYALETAFLKAAAKENDKELWEFVRSEKSKPKMPMPVGNCIGGGLHTKGKEKPDFQEFLFISKEETFSRAITKNYHAYLEAKRLVRKTEKKWRVKTNDEHAWNTQLSNEEALDIMKAIAVEKHVLVGIDFASSSFYKNSKYKYENECTTRDKKQQIEYAKKLAEKFDLFYMEDPLDEEDFNGFSQLKSKLHQSTLLVGDDLTVTNIDRLKKAVKEKSINAMIVKPNQNGSLIKVAEVVKLCKQHNIKVIFSHRSGETMDDALADYAVGFGADFIKTGIFGKERLIKLRRVVEIERSLKK